MSTENNRVAPKTPFDDPRVQIVYQVLSRVDQPPPEGNEHWEGYVSRLIVDSLQAPQAGTVLEDSDKLNAERYLWLRDHSEPGICAFYLSVGKAFDGVRFTKDNVDEAIDYPVRIASQGAR